MADNLNPSQREAVATLSGPLLVLAGAGSGKTRVVTHRIAALIRHGTPPGRILAVTFTNKAATEMRERAAQLLGKRPAQRPEISTFHSLCVRILRRHATRLGYPEKFAIYDRGDQESVARQALREIRVPDTALRPGELLALIGRWKTRSARPEEAASLAASDKEHLGAMAYRRYQQALKLAGAVDFDDLLLCTEELFDRFPDVRRGEAGRFQYVLIDEYQDTNGSQYRIVRALAAGHRNLCVVGDDDQSIYGWRGAEVSHILRFKQDWPDAKVVRLEDNYRSTAAILALANCLIRFNRVRHDKILRAARQGGEQPKILQAPDETTEAKMVVDDILFQLRRDGTEPRDVAILFRTNEQPRIFETELRKAKLPYVLVGSRSFYDRKEVRDLLSYCKLLVQPRDETALRRIINVPARGLGQAAVTLLLDEAVRKGTGLWDVMGEAQGVSGLTSVTLRAVEAFRRTIDEFRRRLALQNPLKTVQELIEAIGYRQEVERQCKEPTELQSRISAVEEFVNSLAVYEQRAEEPSLRDFLDEIALTEKNDDDKDSPHSRNAVVLMTLHSAKGLEFPHVYLVGMEEGLLPHHRSVAAEGDAVDEERRLCYVGVTRAQDRLTLSLALQRMKWGRPRPTQPSRFLFEMIGQADRAGPPTATPAGRGRRAQQKQKR